MTAYQATPSPAVEVVRGIPPAMQWQAASIYYAAFERKLTPILGADRDRVIALLEAALVGDCAFAAVRDDQLLGLLGFHHGKQQLINIGLGTLLKQFGLLKGLWRALIGMILSRQPAAGELLMDGIAVHPDARGQGVGTRLFDALFAFAQAEGYSTIRLDVVNSNPRAQQLYERLGFVAVKTESVPFLKGMGFTASTTMQRTVHQG